ncbi:MAG: cache domain-containing protein, partial [Thermomicrobiales bacterium]
MHGLRFRLVLLVLLASLPALGLLFYTASQQRNDALIAAQHEATNLANLAAVDQQRIIDQNRRYLRTLARLPELRGNDMNQCTSLVQALLGDNAYTYENIGIINKNGEIPCQASGLSSQYFTSNPDRLANALASPEMTIGDIEYAQGAPAGTIVYAYPVVNDAGVTDRLVFATLPFGSLNTFVGQANPPAGTVFRVFDNDEQLIAQYPSDANAAPVPLFATPEAVTTPATQNTNTTVTSAEGETFLFARADVVIPKNVNNSGPAFVSVALPRNEVVSRADGLFQENVGRLAVVAVIAIVAAWLGAD